MILTKEQVEMIKSDAENATMKHGYDMTIIDLCNDWLEMADNYEREEEGRRLRSQLQCDFERRIEEENKSN